MSTALTDPAAERGLLGCLLRRPDDVALVGDRALFSEPRHLAIFDAIRDLHATNGTGVDVWTVIERLPQHRDYLLELLDDERNPGAVTPTPLVRMLEECRDRRRWDSLVKVLQGRIADGHTPADLAEFVRAELEAQPAAGPVSARFRIVSSDEMVSRPPAPQLVEGTVVAGSVVIVHGDSDTFKSTLVLDLSCHVATGRPWHGRTVKQGTVLYVVAEGQAGMPQRLRAWKQTHGVKGAIALGFIEEAVDPLNQADMDSLLAQLRPAPPALLVLDTWSAGLAAGTGDEDKNRDVARGIGALKRFCTTFGTTVIVIHHEGHAASGRPRGGSALRANADATIAVSRKDATITVANPKQKDMAPFAPITFRCVVVEFEDGTSSVTLMPCEGSSLSDGIAGTLLALQDLDTAGATYTDWMKKCGKAETTFRRHVDRLSTEGYVKPAGNLYQLTSKGRTYPRSAGGGSTGPAERGSKKNRRRTATESGDGSSKAGADFSANRHNRHKTATARNGGGQTNRHHQPPPFRGGGDGGGGGGDRVAEDVPTDDFEEFDP